MESNQAKHRKVIGQPCESPDDLDLWLQGYLGMAIPRKAVCAGHCAPFEYVWRAYREPGKDLVVWAPRGGGKTRMAAAVTLADLLHKPGVQARILGGSLAQSGRMWEHLERDVERIAGELIDRDLSSRGTIVLSNGSKASAIAQSQRAVRGLHVQKLRCDEVELFDRGVWEAAQMVTKSAMLRPGKARRERRGNGKLRKRERKERAAEKVLVAGTLEAISTFHKPWGLMSGVIENAAEKGIEVLRWCIFEVMEKCPPERVCSTCPLEADCKGVAKEKCDGFFKIEDVLRIQRRSSRDAWESEMLCKRPSVQGAVYPHFSVDVHVPKDEAVFAKPQAEGECRLAMDFGFNSPFVCLWIVEHEGKTYVIDEYVQPGRMLHEHVEVIESRDRPRAKVVACDPAGSSRNDQTAESNIAFLRRRGYVVRWRKSRIADGVEMVRLALCPAAGEATLFIHPRCVKLIAAMQKYHYAEGGSELPVKDGADHCVDALRYHFVNRGGNEIRWRRY